MQPLDPIVREYYEAEPFQLPYKVKCFDFTVEQVSGYCPSCGKEVEDVRGKINEYGNCIEIDAIGICRQCNFVVKLNPLRYYKEGRMTFKHPKLGWVEGKPKFSLWGRIIILWRELKKMFIWKST